MRKQNTRAASTAKRTAKDASVSERRYKRGYDTNHMATGVQEWLKKAESTAPVANVAEAIATMLSIPVTAIIYIFAVTHLVKHSETGATVLALSVIGYVIAATVIARQQRGLELMVHDASHGAWDRSNRWLNNALANVIVAYPVLSSVEAYWASHRIHHGQYGSHIDPCRQRFAAMGLPHLDLSTRWRITKAVIRWLPAYNAAYYKEIGSQELRQWAYFGAWHGIVFIIPAAIFFWSYLGHESMGAAALAFLAWVFFWMMPALVFLPVIRSIAESEEHDYDRGQTEFETTYTNNGWLHRLLFHPKKDAFHLIHHMFPNIPERKHQRVHEVLMEHDEKYRAALHREQVLGRK